MTAGKHLKRRKTDMLEGNGDGSRLGLVLLVLLPVPPLQLFHHRDLVADSLEPLLTVFTRKGGKDKVGMAHRAWLSISFSQVCSCSIVFSAGVAYPVDLYPLKDTTPVPRNHTSIITGDGSSATRPLSFRVPYSSSSETSSIKPTGMSGPPRRP